MLLFTQIINCHMYLINARQSLLEGLDANRPKTFCFPAQFMSKLLEGGVFNYSFVQRWTTRAGIDVFDHGKIIIPSMYRVSYQFFHSTTLIRCLFLCFSSLEFRWPLGVSCYLHEEAGDHLLRSTAV